MVVVVDVVMVVTVGVTCHRLRHPGMDTLFWCRHVVVVIVIFLAMQSAAIVVFIVLVWTSRKRMRGIKGVNRTSLLRQQVEYLPLGR